MNVKNFVTTREAEFDVLSQAVSRNGEHAARTLRGSAADVAKAVLLRADHGFRYFVAVFPSDRPIDLAKLSRRFGNCRLELASQTDVADHFPDCEFGTVPPFGSEYGLQTLLDYSLLDEDEIHFEGNSRRAAIRLTVADFRVIEQPTTVDFSA